MIWAALFVDALHEFMPEKLRTVCSFAQWREKFKDEAEEELALAVEKAGMVLESLQANQDVRTGLHPVSAHFLNCMLRGV